MSEYDTSILEMKEGEEYIHKQFTRDSVYFLKSKVLYFKSDLFDTERATGSNYNPNEKLFKVKVDNKVWSMYFYKDALTPKEDMCSGWTMYPWIKFSTDTRVLIKTVESTAPWELYERKSS